jgi:hypothetical protein
MESHIGTWMLRQDKNVTTIRAGVSARMVPAFGQM